MKSLNPPKNGLFLVEFVIVLLFFSIVSVVAFQLFAKGSGISTQAYDLNIAVVRAESITERVLASGGEDDQLSIAFDKTQEGYVLYFDGEWKETGAKEGVYQADITVSTEESMLVSEVAIKKGEQELYSIRAERYLGLG